MNTHQKNNDRGWYRLLAVFLGGCFLLADASAEEKNQPQPKPVPQLEVFPEPDEQLSFQRSGRELLRYHYRPGLRRPFLYPLRGPTGPSLTRMGHPQDPQGHSHHESLWISHHDVNGVDFWSDGGKGRIVHRTMQSLSDSATAAASVTLNEWVAEGEVLLKERRRIEVKALEGQDWFLTLDLHFEAVKEKVVFGKIPYGLVGVRMAKTIGVNDGGGMIRNSEGGVNEQGVFWKAAKWVDYSGPVRTGVIEGITLMDHPKNPNHPTPYHVRDDGWMGTCWSLHEARTLERGQALDLRYGFYIHAGRPPVNAIEERWKHFAAEPLISDQ